MVLYRYEDEDEEEDEGDEDIHHHQYRHQGGDHQQQRQHHQQHQQRQQQHGHHHHHRRQQQQQQEDTTEDDAETSTQQQQQHFPVVRLVDVGVVDRLFPVATAVCGCAWLILLAFTYAFTDPSTSWELLTGAEREGAMASFFMFLVSTTLQAMPFFVKSTTTAVTAATNNRNNNNSNINDGDNRSENASTTASHAAATTIATAGGHNRFRGSKHGPPSGIVISAIIMEAIATATAGFIAFVPTVVKNDPITGVRIYLVRYCQWIPTAGLMTFFAEAVDIPMTEFGVMIAVLVGLGQSLAVLCAYFFVFAPNVAAWGLLMFLALSCYATLFPRVWNRQGRLCHTKKGFTSQQLEYYHRCRYAYHLIFMTWVTWTYLVVSHFVVAGLKRLAPEGHWLTHPAVAMMNDSFFDVLAKSFFMKVIIEVHEAVFDAEGRTQRQLNELRRMMSVLWESSTDVIIISVRQKNNLITTMISPTFAALVKSIPDEKIQKNMSIMLETNRKRVKLQHATEEGTPSPLTSESSSEKSSHFSSALGGAGAGTTGTTGTAAGNNNNNNRIRPTSNAYYVDSNSEGPYTMGSAVRGGGGGGGGSGSGRSGSAGGATAAGAGAAGNRRNRRTTSASTSRPTDDPYAAPVPDILIEQAEQLIVAAWDHDEEMALLHLQQQTSSTTTTTTTGDERSGGGASSTSTTGQRGGGGQPISSASSFMDKLHGAASGGHGHAQSPQPQSQQRTDSLLSRDIRTSTGTILKCEVKVTHHDKNAIVAIVRDASDRYKRYEAERKARNESEARLEDAQAANRFTRHEVKNGLLAGIELCGFLRNALREFDRSIANTGMTSGGGGGVGGEQGSSSTTTTATATSTTDTTTSSAGAVATTTTSQQQQQQQQQKEAAEAAARWQTMHQELTHTLEQLEYYPRTTTTTGGGGSSSASGSSGVGVGGGGISAGGAAAGALVGTTPASVRGAVSHYISELEGTLREVLDTVLAEAMARDVVHAVYQAKPERVNVKQWLTKNRVLHQRRSSGSSAAANSMIAADARFPIHVRPANLGELSIDPQLLRYIHRNAVSNALKYGRPGGKIITEVRFFEERGEFEMDIINEPGEGHDEILAMGSAASLQVFSLAGRLPVHQAEHLAAATGAGGAGAGAGAGGAQHRGRLDDNKMSQGDGAWIMQRCATVMGGFCDIRFEAEQTVFSLRCPAVLCCVRWRATELFEVPAGTRGLAVDDSAIQRRLMTRILIHAGVDPSNMYVLGKNPSQVEHVGPTLETILDADPTCKILALVDENLDYMDTDGRRLSGSRCIQDVLSKLPRDKELRILALIRSANDSDDDIAIYRSRAHGFFPKASMDQARVREILSPLWEERFLDRRDYDFETSSTAGGASVASATSQASAASGTAGGDDFDLGEGDLVTRKELLHSLHRVESVLDATAEAPWPRLWAVLHALMGDLRVIENDDHAAQAARLIEGMRGDFKPTDFAERWNRAHECISFVAQTLH